MGRWFLLLLLVPCAAWAAPENTLNKCYYDKASAIAAAASVKPDELPGITDQTTISAKLLNGKATNVKAVKSTGNVALDEAAVACVQAFDFSPNLSEAEQSKTHNITFNVVWHSALVLTRGDLKDTYPTSIGAPHMCLSDYPRHLMRDGVTGTAALLFNVTLEGKVSGIQIAASSGNDELDRVSIACAKRWLYLPGLHDGAPVERPNIALVKYALSDTALPWEPPLAAELPRNCVRDAPVAADLIAATKGPTTVSYKLVQGVVTEPTVTKSSGNAELDARALSCVGSWHFRATNVRGEPSTHDQVAIIDWHEAAGAAGAAEEK